MKGNHVQNAPNLKVEDDSGEYSPALPSPFEHNDPSTSFDPEGSFIGNFDTSSVPIQRTIRASNEEIASSRRPAAQNAGRGVATGYIDNDTSGTYDPAEERRRVTAVRPKSGVKRQRVEKLGEDDLPKQKKKKEKETSIVKLILQSEGGLALLRALTPEYDGLRPGYIWKRVRISCDGCLEALKGTGKKCSVHHISDYRSCARCKRLDLDCTFERKAVYIGSGPELNPEAKLANDPAAPITNTRNFGNEVGAIYHRQEKRAGNRPNSNAKRDARMTNLLKENAVASPKLQGSIQGLPRMFIVTSFCHPIQFNIEPTLAEPCHFCHTALFGITGLVNGTGPKTVEVYKSPTGAGFTEISGGYSEEGHPSTRMCGPCTAARVDIIFCREHVFKDLKVADEQIRDPNESSHAVNAPGDDDTEDTSLIIIATCCSICPEPAKYECCAKSRRKQEGCGFKLCDSCRDIFAKMKQGMSHQNDEIVSAIIHEKTKNQAYRFKGGIRADVLFITMEGELFDRWVQNFGRDANPVTETSTDTNSISTGGFGDLLVRPATVRGRKTSAFPNGLMSVGAGGGGGLNISTALPNLSMPSQSAVTRNLAYGSGSGGLLGTNHNHLGRGMGFASFNPTNSSRSSFGVNSLDAFSGGMMGFTAPTSNMSSHNYGVNASTNHQGFGDFSGGSSMGVATSASNMASHGSRLNPPTSFSGAGFSGGLSMGITPSDSNISFRNSGVNAPTNPGGFSGGFSGGSSMSVTNSNSKTSLVKAQQAQYELDIAEAMKKSRNDRARVGSKVNKYGDNGDEDSSDDEVGMSRGPQTRPANMSRFKAPRGQRRSQKPKGE